MFPSDANWLKTQCALLGIFINYENKTLVKIINYLHDNQKFNFFYYGAIFENVLRCKFYHN